MGKADDYNRGARERIARHIKAIYDRLGETQEEFARRFAVSRPTVTNILNGKTKGIGLDVFIKAWRRLGLDPLVMLEREPEHQRFHNPPPASLSAQPGRTETQGSVRGGALSRHSSGKTQSHARGT